MISISASAILLVSAIQVKQSEVKKNKKRLWVHNWISKRDCSGAYHTLINEFRSDNHKQFTNFMPMDFDVFN